LNIERKFLSTQKKPTSFPSFRTGIYQSTLSKKEDDREMKNNLAQNFSVSLFFEIEMLTFVKVWLHSFSKWRSVTRIIHWTMQCTDRISRFHIKPLFLKAFKGACDIYNNVDDGGM
jgi:hypothetical protein